MAPSDARVFGIQSRRREGRAKPWVGRWEVDGRRRSFKIKALANVRDWYASWATAFPDAVAGATVVCASGETVAIEGLFAGTNTGDFGLLPATGKSVSSPWVNVLHFDHDGRIIAGSVYYDQLTIMIQLGHIDAPATT